MPKGLLDDIPIYNQARDKAWEAFIKRKDVKHLVKHGLFDKGFPLYGGYYELWCQAWDRAWTAGFKDGWDSGHNWAELMKKKEKKGLNMNFILKPRPEAAMKKLLVAWFTRWMKPDPLQKTSRA